MKPQHLFLAIAVTLAAALFPGCTTPGTLPEPKETADTAQTLQPGDVIKISFPATPTMDTTQAIRRDGYVNLPSVGEVQAAEKTPAQLEKELMLRYASQLVSKEVKVTVVTAHYSIYVTGAVQKPGKISPERTLTALEAIMEAGGFDSEKANTKEVIVIRTEKGVTKHYPLNLQAVLDGKSSDTFFLRANDIVYVKEKFNWF